MSASVLRQCTKPKLVRQFIHDCLYHPKTGYFNRSVNILEVQDENMINIKSLRDHNEYNRLIRRIYDEQTDETTTFHQLWHTPSSLFRPWYAQGIASFLVNQLEDEDLIIYEVGPGSGALCKDICAHLSKTHPEKFKKLEYHLVEISQSLIARKLNSVKEIYPNTIHIHNESFLEWKKVEERPCAVLAMEVFDNLPHDRVRFNMEGQLEQAIVITKENAKYGDQQEKFTQIFEPVSDPLIEETISLMDSVGHNWPHLRLKLHSIFKEIWPFSVMLPESAWSSEFIPTGAIKFLKKLSSSFPKHLFLMSDFDKIPDAIPGHGAPVVQTRIKQETVACSTYLLEPGLFDIFFSINFPLLAKIMDKMHQSGGLPITHRIETMKHAAFCKKYAPFRETETLSGYNPMLDDFQNVSILTSRRY